jgi:succinyl-CoA synthetase beta subunit
MRLFEYQTKELFKEQGITVPSAVLIDNEEALSQAIEVIELPCVLKAQVLEGGRGKAGLVKLVNTKEEAKTAGQRILKVTKKKLLVEKAIMFEKELYLSIIIDPLSAGALIMASKEGGMEIEEIAAISPEKIIKEYVDMSLGLFPFQSRNIMFDLDMDRGQTNQGTKFLLGLYNIFKKYEANLVEINPLVVAEEGTLIAVDAKCELDDNALYKHKRFFPTRDHFKNNIEYEAAQEAIPYIQFEGDIGLMVAGAGLANVIYDLVHEFGSTVTNYLEFGGPNYRKAKKCMELILKSKPRCILIATFGTIARADVIAEGIVEAVNELKPTIPIVAVVRGTGEERAKELLKSVGLESLMDTEEAVQKAIQLIREQS